jgi:hypothetical protein
MKARSMASGSGAVPQWNGPSLANEGTAIGAATEQITIAAKRVAELTMRARAIADAVFGGAPDPVRAIQGETVKPQGRVAMLNDQSRSLHQMLDELGTQIDRLTCI